MAGQLVSPPRQPPESSSSSTCRAFPISVALIAGVYNVLVGLSCAYLPDDPLYIGRSIQLYAWAGTVLSILGLAGVVLKRPTLVTSFAHFLLLDTFVAAIGRLLVLHFLLESFHEESLCSDDFDASWSSHKFRHDIVTSARWQKKHLGTFGRTRKRCRMASGAVQVILIAILISMTVAQGSLAVSMRRHGKELEQRPKWIEKPRRSPVRDPEKAKLEGS